MTAETSDRQSSGNNCVGKAAMPYTEWNNPARHTGSELPHLWSKGYVPFRWLARSPLRCCNSWGLELTKFRKRLIGVIELYNVRPTP